MEKFLKYAIVSVAAVLVWEFGHPYIPGLVVDHGAEEHCHDHWTALDGWLTVHLPLTGLFYALYYSHTKQVTYTMSDNMSYTEVLREMEDIRREWRRNDFVYSEGQKDRYELLLSVRRARVTQMYADDQVFKGQAAQSSANWDHRD